MGGTIMDKKVKYIIAIILLLIIASAICSCKTKYVTVPEYHSDTVRISSHDTIIVKQHAENVSVPLPTVYLSNVTKDTVSTLTDGLYKSVASIKDGLLHHYLYTLPNAKLDTKVNANDTTKIHHNALNINRVDSIRVPYPVTKTIEVHSMYLYQKIFMWVGIVCFSICLIWLVFKLYSSGALSFIKLQIFKWLR